MRLRTCIILILVSTSFTAGVAVDVDLKYNPKKPISSESSLVEFDTVISSSSSMIFSADVVVAMNEIPGYNNPYAYPTDITRGFDERDVFVQQKMIPFLAELDKRGREGQDVSFLIIGVGSGIIARDIHEKFPYIDLFFTNKEDLEFPEGFLTQVLKLFSNVMQEYSFKEWLYDPDRFKKFDADIDELPWPDQFFDGVFLAHEVLPYSKRQAHLIGDVKRVLKKDAKGFIASAQNFSLNSMRQQGFWTVLNLLARQYEYFSVMIPFPRDPRGFRLIESVVITNTNPEIPFPDLTYDKDPIVVSFLDGLSEREKQQVKVNYIPSLKKVPPRILTSYRFDREEYLRGVASSSVYDSRVSIQNPYMDDPNVTRGLDQNFFPYNQQLVPFLADLNERARNEEVRFLIVGAGAGIIARDIKRKFSDIDLVCTNKEKIIFPDGYLTAQGLFSNVLDEVSFKKWFYDWDRLSLFDADKDDLPWPDQYFDGVLVANQVLPYIRRPAHLIADVKRVLKKDAKGFITSSHNFSFKDMSKQHFFYALNQTAVQYEHVPYRSVNLIVKDCREDILEESIIITNINPEIPFPDMEYSRELIAVSAISGYSPDQLRHKSVESMRLIKDVPDTFDVEYDPATIGASVVLPKEILNRWIISTQFSGEESQRIIEYILEQLDLYLGDYVVNNPGGPLIDAKNQVAYIVTYMFLNSQKLGNELFYVDVVINNGSQGNSIELIGHSYPAVIDNIQSVLQLDEISSILSRTLFSFRGELCVESAGEGFVFSCRDGNSDNTGMLMNHNYFVSSIKEGTRVTVKIPLPENKWNLADSSLQFLDGGIRFGRESDLSSPAVVSKNNSLPGFKFEIVGEREVSFDDF